MKIMRKVHGRMIGDRLTKGTIAGACGAVVQNVYSYLSHLAGLTKFHYEDFAEVLIFFKLQPGFLHSFIGLVGHLIWDVFLGIIFAYIIQFSSSRHYLLKGTVFGLFIWFFTRITVVLFRVPVLDGLPLNSVVGFMIGGALYGLTISRILHLLDSSPESILKR